MKLRKLSLCIATVSIIFLFIVPHISKAKETPASAKHVTITVCTGDTLWDIASDYIDNSTDIRKFIYDIKKINKLESAMLTPGQQLIIPCD